MHAVVVRVSIKDEENAQKALKEQVVPRVTQLPGFIAGHWTKSDDGSNGMSLIVFESEDAARAASERIGENVPDPVTLESVEVREIVAHA
jgi:heme-degrading monooxygenase HmoA